MRLKKTKDKARMRGWRKGLLLALIGAAAALLCAAAAVGCGLWHAGYQPVEDSFYTSAFVKNKTVLVVAPHEDDETNLCYGVIDAFAQAGSRVVVAFFSNGDYADSVETRVAESTQALKQMGVPEENIVLLGYGDSFSDPIFCEGEADAQRTSPAGHDATYGTSRIADYHTQRFGQPAPYTPRSLEDDLYQLTADLRPDVIFACDTDLHGDHASLSQLFDHAMGRLLRADTAYRPCLFKGFAYPCAWLGDEDFYQLPLRSAVKPGRSQAYHTAYAWEERVRFPVPAAYLGYTQRSSKLRGVLLSYASQNAVERQKRLLNGDRIFWERHTDALFGDVSATSGNAALLQDFVLSGTWVDPLSCCWIPDEADEQPEITFTWKEAQAIGELVFYDSPEGDVRTVRIEDDNGHSLDYTLADTSGLPCRVKVDFPAATRLTIRVLSREGAAAGFSEIEVLPAREQELQWLHLLDSDDNFLYEYAQPANASFTLGLYGYPFVPEQAEAWLCRENGEALMALEYADGSLTVPALAAGRYRVRAESGACRAEVLLRIGDSMLWERLLKHVERVAEPYLPG